MGLEILCGETRVSLQRNFLVLIQKHNRSFDTEITPVTRIPVLVCRSHPSWRIADRLAVGSDHEAMSVAFVGIGDNG